MWWCDKSYGELRSPYRSCDSWKAPGSNFLRSIRVVPCRDLSRVPSTYNLQERRYLFLMSSLGRLVVLVTSEIRAQHRLPRWLLLLPPASTRTAAPRRDLSLVPSTYNLQERRYFFLMSSLGRLVVLVTSENGAQRRVPRWLLLLPPKPTCTAAPRRVWAFQISYCYIILL